MGSKKEQIGRLCPYCGAIITYDEYFCRACHRKLTDQLNLDTPTSARPETYVVPGRILLLSLVLSAFFPGLAQFYNGDTLKGVAASLVFLIVSFGNFGGASHPLVLFVVCAGIAAEGLFSAWRVNTYQRPFAGTSRLLWAGLAVLAILILLHLYIGLPETAYLEKFFPALYFWAGGAMLPAGTF